MNFAVRVSFVEAFVPTNVGQMLHCQMYDSTARVMNDSVKHMRANEEMK